MENFRLTIEKILFNSDEEVICSFKEHFDSNISLFVEETIRAHAKWQEFDSRIGEDEQKAHISSFIFQALNNLISSMKFFIAGYTVPSGNLVRHTIEACATAILCSDKNLPFLESIKQNKFSVNKSTKYLKNYAAKLKINKNGVQDAPPPVLWTHRRVNVIRLKLGGTAWKREENTVSMTGSSSLKL